jgi:hypothetical protein
MIKWYAIKWYSFVPAPLFLISNNILYIRNENEELANSAKSVHSEKEGK